MKSVDEHLAQCLQGVRPLPPVELPLLDAAGCVLAERVTSSWDLPRFDNSAMDGYAVRAADVAVATTGEPVRLKVIADIAAGSNVSTRVAPATCARIMTGAPMPPGADAVVPVEWTDGGTDVVHIDQPADLGAHVRRTGDDLSAGSVVLAAGTVLRPAHLGLLAAVGRSWVLGHPRPRVVVLATGDELVQPGVEPGVGQITDSNSFLLVSAARAAGAVAERVEPVVDDADLVLAALEHAAARSDVLVTTGGVSAGAYDVVKEVLTRVGTVRFDRVAMRPGMPQGHGVMGATPLFTLPGNPVSAFVSFEVFVRPVLRRLAGRDPVLRRLVPAVLGASATSANGKREYLRATLTTMDDGLVATALTGQGSHQLATLARADGLIVVPEDVTAMSAGEQVDVLTLDEGER
ncbi:MAG: gephyrin-like molybdotransferase Glp [Candidatus Nanopelagicales bacterium]